MSKLFSKTTVGPLALQNHLVMSPMTRGRAIGNIPNELMAHYYGQRAASVGLVITEGTSPSPNGVGYARIPGIFSPEQVEGWKLVTKAVHAQGAKIFVQLMHLRPHRSPAQSPEGRSRTRPRGGRSRGRNVDGCGADEATAGAASHEHSRSRAHQG